ncbi:MAG: hypothetical protein ACYDCC_08140 [Actinomycetota bacterium]
MRRCVFVIMLLLPTFGGGSAHAAVPMSAGAMGTVNMTGWACPTMTLGVDFFYDGTNYLVQTGYFPPTDRTPKVNTDCAGVALWNEFSNQSPAFATPCVGPFIFQYEEKPDSMTVSGNTYTISNFYTFCNGAWDRLKTVLTINASTIQFSHTETRNDGTFIQATGTVKRVW